MPPKLRGISLQNDMLQFTPLQRITLRKIGSAISIGSVALSFENSSAIFEWYRVLSQNAIDVIDCQRNVRKYAYIGLLMAQQR